MTKQGHGTILFTGASAAVKGYPRSSSFAMGKFALRGLAQSLARELQPQNIHVGHIVIDGGIAKECDPRANERGPDGLLDPDRDRRDLSQPAPPAAQRLGLGDRAAALDREFLEGARRPACAYGPAG